MTSFEATLNALAGNFSGSLSILPDQFDGIDLAFTIVTLLLILQLAKSLQPVLESSENLDSTR